jgi:TonB family protein
MVMALNMLDEDENLRDLPCLIVALIIHGALFSAPLLRWGGFAAQAPIPAAVAVDFVTQVPMTPPPPEPITIKASPALAPVPAAAEREGIPQKWPGEFQAEQRPTPKSKMVSVKPQKGKQAPAHVKKAPIVARAKPSAEELQAAAQRKAKLAAIAAENNMIREEKLQRARQALAAAAERRAEEARQRKDAEMRAAQEERQRRVEAEQARARRRLEAQQQLAMMSDPDEKLSDAIADTPSRGPLTGSARGRGTLEGALPSATVTAAKMRDGREEVYELEAEGRGDKTVKAKGGGTGPDGGGLSWSLEGPAGSRRLLRRTLPKSPDWVSQRGLELSVQVKFQVQPDGSVKSGSVVKRTSGFPEIDQRALQALAKWRFDPAPGAGPETWGVVTFHFLMN